MKNWLLFIKLFFIFGVILTFFSCQKTGRKEKITNNLFGDTAIKAVITTDVAFRQDSDSIVAKPKFKPKEGTLNDSKNADDVSSKQTGTKYPRDGKDTTDGKLAKNTPKYIPPSGLDEEPLPNSYDTTKYIYVKSKTNGKWWRRPKHPIYTPHKQGEEK